MCRSQLWRLLCLWLAGHHNKRFKAFIAHDGFFNMEQQYLETEELWFTNWDLGGAYWEKNNPAVQRSYANSPHLFVDKWDTPILCIHGEKDFRSWLHKECCLQCCQTKRCSGTVAHLP